MNASRRKFLDGLLGLFSLAGLAALAYPILRYITPIKKREDSTLSVVASKINVLTPNTGKLFKFGSKPGILIMTPEGKYRAFSAVCTHLGCIVQYSSKDQQIWCPCHNGWFDLNGHVVSGPPPRDLERYTVFIKGQDIIVKKEKA